MDTVKWAFVWAAYTENDAIAETWVAKFRDRARAKPQSIDMVRSMYEAAAWRLALLLRAGESFDDATADLLKEKEWFRDFEDTYQPPRGRDDGDRREYTAGGRRTGGRQSERGGNTRDRFQDSRRPAQGGEDRSRFDRAAEQSDWFARANQGDTVDLQPKQESRGNRRSRSPLGRKKRPLCQDYQTGKCVNGVCPKGNRHACSKCDQGGHGAHRCKR